MSPNASDLIAESKRMEREPFQWAKRSYAYLSGLFSDVQGVRNEGLAEDRMLSFADFSDMVVACVTGALILILCGYGIAVYHYENRRFECPTMLPDGRDLIARHLGENGDEKCTYAAPRPMRKL